jgi:protein-disulfide isomerase
MNKNSIIITIVSILGTFLLLYGVYMMINQPVQTDFPQTRKLRSTDHIKWSSEKKNILVEYSDFQCPSCKNFHNLLKSIESSGSADFTVTKKITFVFRDYPLYQIHDKAYLAAYAAEAAFKQGKFWEMSDLLFDNQEAWAKSNDPQKDFFQVYAKKLGLDVNLFIKDSSSSEIKNRVGQDLLEAEQMGVDSTPTFFLNGKKINVNSYNELIDKLKSL